MRRWTFFCFGLLSLAAAHAQDAAQTTTLRGRDGTEAVFEKSAHGYQWVAYRDTAADAAWPIDGPRFSLQTPEGLRVNLGEAGFARMTPGEAQVVLETSLPAPAVDVRQVYAFCDDGRTLRITTSLRARGEPLLIQRLGLLELTIPKQPFQLMGPGTVSSPVFGDALFAGIEHPSAACQVKADSFWLAQDAYLTVGKEWTTLPGAVLGSSSKDDVAMAGGEALRRAFLRYLDTVRVKPADMHVHYNDWWTAPVPSSEQFVLQNLAELKKGLYDQTGFFFDSYALDAGWSNPKSVWEMDTKQFPQRFAPIRAALEGMGSHVGLWISPSSMYSFALDNHWLESAGYEVMPHPAIELVACLAKGGKYQAAFKNAVLGYAREAKLAHVKFDGFVPRCDVAAHGHRPGAESYLPIAEGLMEVFDALRAQNPSIALEPTCFGYQPSPWWLMHVPFIIGPFGDDSPYGRCPAPDYIESMTTAREIENIHGRGKFLMPSAALQCFDIIVQCPGAFQNHAAMAIGRGHWFISSYINPKYMDGEEWRFFADLMKWARHNRDFLREPLPIGGDPEKREAYGYAFFGADRQVYCLRNPWIEEAAISLCKPFASSRDLELRMLYPRRGVIARITPGAPLPDVPLGPYETQFVEVVATDQSAATLAPRATPEVHWKTSAEPKIENVVFGPDPPAFGPSWSSPDGARDTRMTFLVDGNLALANAVNSQLCVLCEGDPAVAENSCRIAIDNADAEITVSKSQGAFGASGVGWKEHWIWFLAEVPTGKHEVHVEVSGPALGTPIGIFLRGDTDSSSSASPFDDGPAFPLYRADRAPWSRVLVPLAARQPGAAPVQAVPRRIVKIDGVYLDTINWSEATAGWGKVRRNLSIMEKPMTLGGRIMHRGIGAHAPSRVTYALPEGYSTFAALIGKDQEVSGGSVVFVVETDGRECFRSGLFRNDTPPQAISVSIAGAKQLTLKVENGGDDFGADHADWAEARLLK